MSITQEWKAGKPAEGWRAKLAPEFQQAYMKAVISRLDQDRERFTLHPEPKNIFRAFSLTDYEAVKVCILGQDPYHSPNTANGLAFSVYQGQRIPPSLLNIYKEISADLGAPMPNHGDLEQWARQGVFLLNTSLTVIEGRANSHSAIGWEKFTGRAIAALSAREKPLVFMLWGKNAQSHQTLIDGQRHLILKSPHPSPFSADRGFFGCRHFSKANAFLKSHGIAPVDWEIR